MHITEFSFHTLRFVEIVELHPEVWGNLSDKKKIEVLQECSNRICDFENRPRSNVEIVDFNKLGLSNKECSAAFFPKSNVIGISPEYLKNASSYDMFGKLVHESMHGYVNHAIHKPGFHKNTSEVNEWKEGYQNYRLPHDNESYILYGNNAVERQSVLHEIQFKRLLEREHQLLEAQQQLETEAKDIEAPKEIIKQLSDNKFQTTDPSSGEQKTYTITLRKGKTLKEVMHSHADFISQIDNLEKGQHMRLNKISESPRTVSDSNVERNRKEQNQQNKPKDKGNDFER